MWRKCAEIRPIAVASGCFFMLLAIAAACQPENRLDTSGVEAVSLPSSCGKRGYLSTSLYGAIDATLDWASPELECEGMPRPGSEGARLRFAGTDGERRLAIIIALPDLERGTKGRELASKVTLIEEGSGRFFSTAAPEACWTDVTLLETINGSGDRYAIGGTLYCLSPLAEVNGASSVTIAELRFQGLLDWGAS